MNNNIDDFNFSDNGFVLAEEQPSNVDLSSANVEEDFINKRRKEMPKVNMRNPFVSPNDNSFNNDKPTTVKPPIVSANYTGKIIEIDSITDEKPDESNNIDTFENNDNLIIPVDNGEDYEKANDNENLPLNDNENANLENNSENNTNEIVDEGQKSKQSFFKRIFNIK